MEIVWTVVEKVEIFIERSGEKNKRHDWKSSSKFFSTPKIYTLCLAGIRSKSTEISSKTILSEILK